MDTLGVIGSVGAVALVAATVLASLALVGAALARLVAPAGARGGVERAALCLGLGFAGTIAAGLALNLLPWGLSGGAWLAALTLLLVAAALRARRNLAGLAPRALARARAALAGGALRALPLYLGAALLLGGAFGVVRHGALTAEPTRFTQLWALEAPGRDAVLVGVHNAEGAPAVYRLQLVAGGRTVADWPAIALEPGATWRGGLAVGGLAASHVEATLYVAGRPEPYRRVSVQLAGADPAAGGR